MKLTTARAIPTPVLLTPSARIEVLPGRPPFTVRLKPGTGWPEVTSGSSLPASPETLATVTARSSTLRLLSGTSWIWRSVMVWLLAPDSRFMTCASAVTLTTSDPAAPISSVTLTVTVLAVSTFTGSITVVLKPGVLTATR